MSLCNDLCSTRATATQCCDLCVSTAASQWGFVEWHKAWAMSSQQIPGVMPFPESLWPGAEWTPLTHFEVGGLQCGAGEQPGEDHVYRDREAPTDIPISNLNILNLCSITGIAFRTPWEGRKCRVRAQQLSKWTDRQDSFQHCQPASTCSPTSPFCSSRFWTVPFPSTFRFPQAYCTGGICVPTFYVLET
jgi:hypothetical protein